VRGDPMVAHSWSGVTLTCDPRYAPAPAICEIDKNFDAYPQYVSLKDDQRLLSRQHPPADGSNLGVPSLSRCCYTQLKCCGHIPGSIVICSLHLARIQVRAASLTPHTFNRVHVGLDRCRSAGVWLSFQSCLACRHLDLYAVHHQQ
jgi:hypothetical protein